MKKELIFLASGVLVLGFLTGCSNATTNMENQAAAQEQAGTIAMEAVTDDVATLVTEQIEQDDTTRKEEIKKKYAMYKKYGLTYNSNKDLFFYQGKTVRYFKDAISISETNGFFYENGVIDLTAKRNSSGELEKLIPASQEEFDERTANRNEMEATYGDSVGEATYTYETGDKDYATVQDGSVPDGINVMVKRDKKGKIQELCEITEEEMRDAMK